MELAKKVGRQSVHVHILSACLPFCQRISRSRQAEPKVLHNRVCDLSVADHVGYVIAHAHEGKTPPDGRARGRSA
jgi:hypothetical protein